MPHFTRNRPCSPDMLKEHLSAKPTRIPALDEMLRPLESAADEDCLGGALISQLSNHWGNVKIHLLIIPRAPEKLPVLGKSSLRWNIISQKLQVLLLFYIPGVIYFTRFHKLLRLIQFCNETGDITWRPSGQGVHWLRLVFSWPLEVVWARTHYY